MQEGGNIKCVLAIEVIGIEERQVNRSGGPSWSLSSPLAVISLHIARSLFPGVILSELAMLAAASALINASYKKCRDNLGY